MKEKGSDAAEARLTAELEAARARLRELESTLQAIRQDRVDALVVSGPRGEEIKTLLGLADSLFNQVSQPVFVLDGGNRILQANRLARALCGEIPENALFQEAVPLLPVAAGGGPGPVGNPLPENWVREGLEIVGLEVSLPRPDGQTFYFLLNAKPIPGAPMVEGGIVSLMDITRRKLDEIHIAVRNEQIRYQFGLTKAVTDSAAEGLILLDGENRVAFMNPAAGRILGIPEEEMAGRSLPDRFRLETSPEDGSMGWPFAVPIPGGEPQKVRGVFARGDGTRVPVHCSLSAVKEGGALLGSVLVIGDISDQAKAEAALLESLAKQRQSQKMEAIGRLAGGIAHDFNNLLLAILGFADLSIPMVDERSALRENLDEIKKASEKAALLTRQLLAYGRKQVLAPRIVGLNEAVGDILVLLQRIVGEKVRLETDLNGTELTARVDKAQLHQVIINLAANARDAMPDGGTLGILTYRLANTAPDSSGMPASLQKEGDEALPAGEYGVVEVRDTGHGMDEELMSHLFEPFFTTKEFGKGSGLGLSTAYGIVKQMGGTIQVFSAPGRGAVFRICFPLVEEAQADAGEADSPQAAPPRADGDVVLLAEDEEVVRRLLAKVLSESGYAVFQARNGEEALSLLSEHGDRVDLLVTDVVMDRMGGRELAEHCRKTRPEIKVLFISGYSEQDTAVEAGLESAPFIAKPFRPADFLKAVRELLDGRKKRGSMAAPGVGGGESR